MHLFTAATHNQSFIQICELELESSLCHLLLSFFLGGKFLFRCFFFGGLSLYKLLSAKSNKNTFFLFLF